jgi:hypothetical protein
MTLRLATVNGKSRIVPPSPELQTYLRVIACRQRWEAWAAAFRAQTINDVARTIAAYGESHAEADRQAASEALALWRVAHGIPKGTL